MRIHDRHPIPEAEILTRHHLELGGFTGSRLSDDIKVSESIFIFDPDFFGYAFVRIHPEEYPLGRKIDRCFDDLEILPPDLGSLVVLGMREVEYGSNLFDIENRTTTEREWEIPENILPDKSFEIRLLLRFEGIPSGNGVLRKR